MRKIILSLFLVLLFGGVLTAVIMTGRVLFRPAEADTAIRFLPPGPSFFVSLRGVKDFADGIGTVREQKIPLVGRINKYIYMLEYVLHHKFTARDWIELAGEDIAIQFTPRFLLATRTRRAHNVFFHLDIKNDTEVRRAGFGVRSKFLPPLGRSLHYVFLDDWLVVSDDMNYLVHALKRRGRRRFPAGPETLDSARFLLGWSGRRAGGSMPSVWNVFGRRRVGLICGPSAEKLRFYPHDESLDEVAAASSGLLFFRYDLRAEAGHKGALRGAVVLTGLTEKDGYLLPARAYYIPAGLHPEELRRVNAALRNTDGRQDLFLAQEIMERHHVLHEGEVLPLLDRKGVLFFLDGPALARTRAFDSAMSDLLIRAGRIEVRP